MGDIRKSALDFMVLGAVYFIFLFRKWKSKGKDRLLVNTLLYIYLCFLLYFTLMPILASIPFIFTHPYVPMNMLPFDDYFAGRGDTVRQIFLNVLLMVPLGFLLPMIKKSSLWRCIVITFLFSLSIELLQPFIDRAADSTDVITNTVGGILGYFLFLLLRPLAEAVLKRLRRNA